MQNLVELFVKVWNETFVGVSVGQLAVAAFVFLLFLFLRRFFARVVIARLKALANKTKTDLDDRILAALQQPLKQRVRRPLLGGLRPLKQRVRR